MRGRMEKSELHEINMDAYLSFQNELFLYFHHAYYQLINSYLKHPSLEIRRKLCNVVDNAWERC